IFFVNISQVFSQQNLIGKRFKGSVSYYDSKFVGRRTASGEVLQKGGLTCAHKTLPFGTMLEVENPKNGKKTIVRVNDRGPFTKSRILDLSYAAAVEIDLISYGVLSLNLKVIGTNKHIDDQYKVPDQISVVKDTLSDTSAIIKN
ncbi:MAG: septal ring lytic transglycosylase RlpA family protein, partial [Leadbetterella sp.]